MNDNKKPSSETTRMKNDFNAKKFHEETPTRKSSKKCLIFTITGVSVAILIIAAVVIYLVTKGNKQKENNIIEETDDTIESSTYRIINPSPTIKEFEINKKQGDLRMFSVVQETKDQTKIDGKPIETNRLIKTNYAIYIISEEDADEQHKLYYTKMYKAAVSITSECSSNDEDCEPQTLLDLINGQKTDSKRYLEESEESENSNIKDFPISLCLFNITDNHIITTITCHESFPELQKAQILRHLYFRFPPSAQRIDKESDNITITKTIDPKTKRTKIREINGGNCNIYNNFGSLCSTEMNTTIDSENNLLTYNEEAITTINYDEKNSYISSKVTNLIDYSEKIKSGDVENYKNSLKILLPLLEPYMKEDTQFSNDDFSDFLDRYKDKTKKYIPKKTKNTFRRLEKPNYTYNQLAQIFSQKAKGIEAKLSLEINPGINSDIVGAYGAFNFDDKEVLYSAVQNISTINELINRLASISKAGNQLATELYDSIIEKMEQILNQITIKVNDLIALLKYYDLNDIFNSTLSLYAYNKLPRDIIDASNELLSSLSGIYTQIKYGNVNNNLKTLNKDIYNYIEDMNNLIIKMLNNLDDLTKTLIDKNNTYTMIINYYSNETSTSYVNIIQSMKEILNNYFIYEYNLIFPKIQNLVTSFNESTNNALKKDLRSLKDLFNNLVNGSYIINNITNQEKETVLSNLDNSHKYPKDIITKIDDYIYEMLELKKNGYFISDDDIDNLNKTFYSILLNADEVSKKLNDVSIIDKVFDEIMTKFRDNYIDTLIYMEQLKSKNFKLDEDVLNISSFNQTIKNKFENELKSIIDQILEKMKITNNFDKIKKYFTSYFHTNLDELNTLISDLDLIFSEEELRSLSTLFELCLKLSLEQIAKEINNNIKLSKEYYGEYYNVINDKESLINFTKNRLINNPKHPKFLGSSIYQMINFDEIKEKEYTSAYLSKHNTFMANLNFSEEYLVGQLYYDIVNEHREIFDEIKEKLQSILDNKLTERFSDFEEVDFYNNHIKIVEKLNERLNKYFSQDYFDNKYLKIINDSINLNKNNIEEAKQYINSRHNSFIQNLDYYRGDYSNDFCIVFKRKVCYGCYNCVSYTFFFDRICIVLSPYENNYLNIKKIDYEILKNLTDFENSFSEFNSKITKKIERYNFILNNLTIYINTLSDEGKMKNITLKDFEPLEKWINDTLKNNFNDVLLKSVYNHYKQNLQGKLENMFDDIFEKWEEMFSNLKTDVENNKDKIKSSLYEFSMIASIYTAIIRYELTQNYYNSIVLFQESEFNYAISFYYNYLIKLVTKYYKYMINKIQTKEYDFNGAIKERKKEIDYIFDIFIDKITSSENYYLELENQLEILLNVNKDDFFGLKYIMVKNINETDIKLEKMVDDIFEQEYFIESAGDDYSLAMRFYLENKEFGKLVKTYYEPIDREEFFDFHLDKFKDILKENWVFDEGDFIYILNNALFATNKVIKNDLSVEMEEYSTKIEKEITKSFNDSLENIIDDLYKNKFYFLTNNLGREIKTYIANILDSIKKTIQNEAERIKGNSGVYIINNDKIKGRIDNYTSVIISKLNNIIFYGLNKFQENIHQDIYLDCIENRLSEYLSEAKIDDSSEFGEFKLVNSSYNIGDTIYNLAKEIIDNYKAIIINKIKFNYNEYHEKINSILDIEQTNQHINSSLNIIFKEVISSISNLGQTCSSTKCEEFDFNDDALNQINNAININLNYIKDIISQQSGNNYEANFKCTLDFTNAGINTIKPICKSFKRFLTFENNEQGTLINKNIQDYIKNNLDGFLNNVIPTYGNPFFERIIDYNINFKIKDFYCNLRYSLAQTILYYYILNKVKDYGDLPSDLKDRLYRLNDLDLTLKTKQEEIEKLLERKLSGLIDDLKDTAKETYIYYLKENDVIKNSFSSSVLEKIDYNFEEIMEDLDKKYQNALEKYLKEKFTASFSEILEIETKNATEVFYSEQKRLKEQFDELLSSNEDNDLKAVNDKINQTFVSLQDYKEFCDSFEISQSVINFFMNYGNNTLVPLFLKFDKDLNNKMKIIIMNLINEKSKVVEDLRYNVFNSYIQVFYDNIYNNYIDNILNSIYSYGRTNESYYSNLNYTKNKIYEKLIDNSNEDDSYEETKKLIETKDVEDALNTLINRAYNNYYGANKLIVYNNFLADIEKNQNKVNIESKNIRDIISKNKYNKEIILFLSQKLNNLEQHLINYYSQINSKFYSIYNSYLRYDLSSIYSYLNYYCLSYTKWALNYEYEKIYKNTKPINYRYSNYIEKYDKKIEYKHESEHMINKANASLYGINEHVEFKLDMSLEGNNFKRPKVKAKIVDGCVPKNVEFNILSECGKCCKEGHLYNITLNGASHILTIDYDAKVNIINIKTNTNIEKYDISEILYIDKQKEISVNANFDSSIFVNRTVCSKTEKNYTIYYQNTTQISSETFEDSIDIIK